MKREIWQGELLPDTAERIGQLLLAYLGGTFSILNEIEGREPELETRQKLGGGCDGQNVWVDRNPAHISMSVEKRGVFSLSEGDYFDFDGRRLTITHNGTSRPVTRQFIP